MEKKKKKKWHGVCLWMLLLLQGLWWQWGCCSECRPDETVFQETTLDGTHVVALECRARTEDLYSVTIDETRTSGNPEKLVTLSEKKECITKTEKFAACDLGSDSVRVVKVLVTDLKEWEHRNYTCVIAQEEESDLKKQCYALSITKEATPETETEEKPNVATSDGESSGVSSVLFIVVVVALIIAVIFFVVLGLVFWKQKRNSAVDPDSTSIRSAVTDKSFHYTTQAALAVGAGGRGGTGMEMGLMGGMGGMGTLSHHTPTSPAPSLAAPDVPGGGQRLVMNYQRPFNTLPATSLTLDTKDVRRLYENAVQYQEPWGAMTQSRAPPHATSTLTRPPNPHLVMIPDVSTTTPPGEDTDPIAPPTQETDPASIEDSAFSE
ncbi:uncharacterized protein LOC143297571 isoform X2 [Babylonia areolata]|uniref:uncharacterized protein LOC143297571 isoform X2 n=1 Tax=Babylonia areolata TaxID=304850 RepID=UPI003FD4DC08